MEEEELKGLEEEIDNAVERLFVEKKKGVANTPFMESLRSETPLKPFVSEQPLPPPTFEPSPTPLSIEPLKATPMESLIEPPIEPSLELPSELSSEPTLEPSPGESSFIETTFMESTVKPIPVESEPHEEVEKTLQIESPPSPPLVPIPLLKSMEKMEAQLLSLEWEITEEKLKRTREEVLLLRDLMKQKADIASTLNWMESILTRMMKSEENIQPSWMKFLLDSKETIKLLMKKEPEGEIHIYKQLAYHGIEARFTCLEEAEKPSVSSPPVAPRQERVDEEKFLQIEKRFQDALNQMNVISGKMDDVMGKIESYLSELGTWTSKFSERLEDPSLNVKVTIFKVDEKLFGVESQKVYKLFKVPNTFPEKYSNQPKVRLKDLEVEMIDLRKLLSIQPETPKNEIRILTVKDNGRVRGFMIDQVLNQLSTLSSQRKGEGEYFSGVIQYTYQEQPVEIPILDLKRI